MDVEKNGGRLFRRPKLTLSCSAEGKEGRKEGRLRRAWVGNIKMHLKRTNCELINYLDTNLERRKT
jgi:hypothetical protein